MAGTWSFYQPIDLDPDLDMHSTDVGVEKYLGSFPSTEQRFS